MGHTRVMALQATHAQSAAPELSRAAAIRALALPTTGVGLELAGATARQP